MIVCSWKVPTGDGDGIGSGSRASGGPLAHHGHRAFQGGGRGHGGQRDDLHELAIDGDGEQVAGDQVVDRGGYALVGSADGHGEVGEIGVLGPHEGGDQVLNVGADRRAGVVGEGVATTFAGGVVEQVPAHQKPAVLEN